MEIEKIKPIRPEDANAEKLKDIPDAVFEVFNNQIVRNLSAGGRRAVVYQDVVVNLLEEGHNMNRGEIYKNGWLDVEPLYREAGWKVVYDKPAYNETYRAHFIFSKERRGEQGRW